MKKILVLISLTIFSVCSNGQSKFTTDGFDCEVLKDGTVSISRKPMPYLITGNTDSVFHIPSTVEYEGKVYPVRNIAKKGFAGNTDIKHLVIDEGIEQIRKEAFICCINLQSIRIPASIAFIEENIIGSCYNLESIVVDSYNEDYDSRDNCNAIIETESNTLIAACGYSHIPHSITVLGPESFSNCQNLADITIPEGVTQIEDHAFSGCENLKSISLPQSLERIGMYVFWGCSSLQSIVIPKNVKKIEHGGLFRDCNRLVNLNVEAGNEVYDSRQGCNAIIETVSNTLVTACVGTRFVEGIQGIGESAFEGIPLQNLHIPKSITTIGRGAFFQCGGLTSITVDDENPTYASPVGSNAILTKDLNTLILGCEGTVFPEELLEIGELAFAGNNVPTKTIFLPESLRVIGESAFFQCANLLMVIIPSSVESIGDWAFGSCPNLNIVQFTGKYKIMDSSAFFDCKKLAVVELPEGITTIGHSAFADCTNLYSVSIPSSLVEIRHGAFRNCPCEKDVMRIIQNNTR